MTFLMFRTTTGAASIEKPTKPPDDLAQTVRVCRNNLLPLPSRLGFVYSLRSISWDGRGA